MDTGTYQSHWTRLLCYDYFMQLCTVKVTLNNTKLNDMKFPTAINVYNGVGKQAIVGNFICYW